MDPLMKTTLPSRADLDNAMDMLSLIYEYHDRLPEKLLLLLDTAQGLVKERALSLTNEERKGIETEAHSP